MKLIALSLQFLSDHGLMESCCNCMIISPNCDLDIPSEMIVIVALDLFVYFYGMFMYGMLCCFLYQFFSSSSLQVQILKIRTLLVGTA